MSDSAYAITNMPANAGDNIFFSVWFSTVSGSSDADINFYVSNKSVTPNVTSSFSVRLKRYAGIASSAEWIYERPQLSDGSLATLAKPISNSQNTVPFNGNSYKLDAMTVVWTSLADASNIYNITMKNTSSTVLASTGSISSSNFNVTWKNYK